MDGKETGAQYTTITIDEEAAAEIDRQATEGQRELQRLADEAAEAMRETL